jgi:endo-1,4-beta-xylanase
MMNRFHTFRHVFLLCLLLLFSGEKAFGLPALRTLAEDRGIEIRTAVKGAVINSDPVYPVALATQFNMATPELSLLFKVVHPTSDTYDFIYSDLVVGFAEAADMEVNGHTLVWHPNHVLPNWIKWKRRAELLAILEDHIKTVVGRYKGRIKSWDVINEAIGLNGRFRTLTFWLHRIGPEVIDLAFQWAHEADPDALLFYKDYAVPGAKADSIYQMVSGMLQRGIPIHGVNIQTHVLLDIGNVDKFFDDVAYNMKRLSELGLQVNITEMDVPVRLPATDDELQAQASIYAEALRLCLCSPSCKVFEMWGFTDLYTWMDGNNFGGWGAPLILDDTYTPKPAFYALADVLTEFYDADVDGIRDDNGSCTRISNPCRDGVTVGCYDNCPNVANPGQEDQDDDTIGDACDICPTDPLNDSDGDGFCAAEDNCPAVANPGQEDGSCVGGIWQAHVPDGIGNTCQDSDGDLLTDSYELDTGRDPCVPAIAIVPDIKANGMDGTVVVSQGDNLTVTISIDPGDYIDVLADFWINAYSYNQSTDSWEPISTNSNTAPIVALPPLEILNTTSFPYGTFMFSFGIDFDPDGSLDTDWLVGDSVKVTIE